MDNASASIKTKNPTRAEDRDGSEFFNSGQTLNNDLLFGEFTCTDSHCDGHDSGQTNGNGSNRDNEDLSEGIHKVHSLCKHLDKENDNYHDNCYNDQEVADTVNDFLKVSFFVCLVDEVRGAANVRVNSSLGDHGKLLALFDNGRGVCNSAFTL